MYLYRMCTTVKPSLPFITTINDQCRTRNVPIPPTVTSYLTYKHSFPPQTLPE